MKKTIPDLCFQCHDAEDFLTVESEEAVLHSPVEDGACNACHNPHESRNETLLLRPLAETCFECHDRGDFVPEPGEGGKAHAPVKEGRCDACHTAHKATFGGLLHESLLATCLECHENAPESHPKSEGLKAYLPFETHPGACGECHDPHVVARQDTGGGSG